MDDESTDEKDPLIGYPQIAEMMGVRPATARSYAHRRNAGFPPPDDTTVPDRPRWRTSTFLHWLAGRPGRGRWAATRGGKPRT